MVILELLCRIDDGWFDYFLLNSLGRDKKFDFFHDGTFFPAKSSITFEVTWVEKQ